MAEGSLSTINERLFRSMVADVLGKIGDKPTEHELTWPNNTVSVNRKFLRELLRRERELAQLRALITTPEVAEFIRSTSPQLAQG